jgi:hypothetical protein
VVAEHEGWSVLLHGHPVAADGATLDGARDEARDDFLSALRAYADAQEGWRPFPSTYHETFELTLLGSLVPRTRIS